MTISLVTGAAGFLGSHVCDHLIKMGHRVVAVDDLSGGNLSFAGVTRDALIWGQPCHISDSFTFLLDTILQPLSVDMLFEKYSFDYVFHLAAYASEGLSHHIRHYLYENNIVGSANLINAAVNADTVKRMVFTSSVAVYGHRAYRATEHDQLEPIDPYGIGKLATELDLKAAQEYYGLPYTIFRPHNIFGPRQNMNDKYRNVVAIFMRQAMLGKSFSVYGDGLQTRAFTYVRDVASAIASCVDIPDTENETYNIGSDTDFTILELARKVAQAFDVECSYTCLPERKEANDATPSHAKARRVFGVVETELLDGLEQMAAWAKTQTLLQTTSFPTIEIERNLPEIWRK